MKESVTKFTFGATKVSVPFARRSSFTSFFAPITIWASSWRIVTPTNSFFGNFDIPSAYLLFFSLSALAFKNRWLVKSVSCRCCRKSLMRAHSSTRWICRCSNAYQFVELKIWVQHPCQHAGGAFFLKPPPLQHVNSNTPGKRCQTLHLWQLSWCALARSHPAHGECADDMCVWVVRCVGHHWEILK